MCKIHYYLLSVVVASLTLFQPLTLFLCVSLLPLVSVSCDFSDISSVEPQLPAVQAPVFLLQPPHVINHVKWQKAQHCQDCVGNLMELKMGCFVVMQSILFHPSPACFHHALKRQIFLLVPARKSKGCLYFKQRSRQ